MFPSLFHAPAQPVHDGAALHVRKVHALSLQLQGVDGAVTCAKEGTPLPEHYTRVMQRLAGITGCKSHGAALAMAQRLSPKPVRVLP